MPALRLTQLNYDVLYSILYRLDTPALYAINLANKGLNGLSFPHLYRDVRLLRDPTQIIALCRSVLAAKDSRVGHAIRRLEIDKEAFHTGPSVIWMGPSGLPALCPPEYHLFAATLADAIQKMPNLRAISIGAWVEDLFFFEPRVARAITSRPRLAKIKLCGLRNGTSELLQALRHLRAINLPYPLGSITADSGIGKVILDSQHTLEELTVPMLSDPRDVLGGSDSREDELPIWPRVHTLVIANSTLMDPMTLSRAFPSTVHFSGTGVFNDTADSDEVLPIWPLLKSVEGDYSLVRVLARGRKGLRRIFLRARSEEDFVTKERAEEFIGLVKGPSVRSLRLTVWADMPRSFFEDLFRSVPQLAFLEIEIAEGIAVSRGSALLKLFEIIACLSKLHLSYVSFVIRPQITPTGPISIQPPEDPEHSRHALLRLIYKTCPTIRAMQLEARGLRWPTTWWKAIDAPCPSEGILAGMREEEGMEERRWYDWHA